MLVMNNPGFDRVEGRSARPDLIIMGETSLIFQHYAIHAPCLSIWEGHHSKEKDLEITLGFPVFIVEQIPFPLFHKQERR